MATHYLKIWKEYFEAQKVGMKNFEVRKNDRHFWPGDDLVLEEWDREIQVYTGRFVKRRVTYMLFGDGANGIVDGYVVLGTKEDSQEGLAEK